jgi:S1-C subfamily serine protease
MRHESVDVRNGVTGIVAGWVSAGLLTLAVAGGARADAPGTIERVKESIVLVGTLKRTRTPSFRFLGTGFAVGDGTLIATNAHVLPATLDAEGREALVILVPGGKRDAQVRDATRLAVDAAHDLALLRISGAPLRALGLRDSASVREGELFLFTGFPIGSVLGPYPATHRGMVAAITPIAIPSAGSSQLDARTVRQLARGAFPVFQLDATAFPGSSGSPLYDAETAEVVGIINMVLVRETKEANLPRPSGIAYAIPAAHLWALLQTVR